MNVTGDDGVGMLKQSRDLVAEEHFHLTAFALNQIGVEVDIVHTGEGMDDMTEVFTELRQGQHVGIRIDTRLVQQVPVHKVVPHFIGGIGEEQHDFPAAGGHAAQQQREAVAAQNRESDADCAAAGLAAEILRNLFDGCIVALGTCHDRLRDRHNVTVTGDDAGLLPGCLNRIRNDLRDVIALTDDGCADTAHNSADGSHDDERLLFHVA